MIFIRMPQVNILKMLYQLCLLLQPLIDLSCAGL